MKVFTVYGLSIGVAELKLLRVDPHHPGFCQFFPDAQFGEKATVCFS